ncbi:ASCH domain-containing protein [Clavibacter michiganensis]|uniref:ASCH domain-containing protein n=1 Tax=Clavibacter michiganensis TaxID=28447 RepID=UPI001365D1DA|nr:ASCH domain-containing protein [Clavibacter michiganensis]MDO4017254.1 ASCH domain-containing protein [Clavibacter michiganensis]MDO4037510.1 ASCH domain-containing protein [Clavibacter michiganensis]MDO4039900.1 ASCH domain-containing protein [Clavibacter michiganensis]MDO4050039.1 ASCH domain-containing protein [Clavibacter michiganensis]MDO4060709.1 ASCH domain-containing protein [Clavibacter michiganensis]
MSDADAQVIRFQRKHHDAIVSGEKVTTVRFGERLRVGPATLVFDEHPTAVPLAGRVTSVRRHLLADLTPADAHQPPDTDMALFAEQLRENYYPTMPASAAVVVAEIQLEGVAPVG